MIKEAPPLATESTVYEEIVEEPFYPDAIFETVITYEHVLGFTADNLALLPRCDDCRRGDLCHDMTCQSVWGQIVTIAWNRLETTTNLSREYYLGNVSSSVDFSKKGYRVSFWER